MKICLIDDGTLTQIAESPMSDLNHENNVASLMEDIHNIQRQLSDLNSRLQRGPKMLKAQENAVNRLLAQLEQVRGEHHQLSKTARYKEEQLAQSENALNRRREQMQEAKNNKEFQALKLQIQADEAANSVLADEALEAIEKADNFMPHIEAAEKELQAAQDLWKKTQESIEKELPLVEADIVRCSDRLKIVEQKVPKEFKDIYLRLARSMGGEQALAWVTDGNFCGGCRQLIPINFVAQVVQGKPVTCKSCGRLLYAPKGFTIK